MQSSTSEGRGPNAGVCQSANGLLYGTVYYGGSSSVGAIFEVDTAGNYNLVRSFQTTGGDGQNPNSELVESSDGFLYGATYAGGSGGGGSLFKIKNDGTGYTVLQNFSTAANELETPNSLAKGLNGALYGTTRYGGGLGAGCVFALTASLRYCAELCARLLLPNLAFRPLGLG